MNVLVAEDSDVIRAIIMQIISELGHTVCAAENGLEAVELFKDQNAEKIDLIVMDAEMPIMDGMTSTSQIRTLAGDDWLPIIFLSAHSEDSYLQKALDSGADVYLRKPINKVELAAQIKAMGRIAEMKNKLDEVNVQLHDLANQDGLTKIANRRAFNERINYELKQSHRNKIPFSLVLCDIDYFKLYNDTYGHLAGDNCLKKVAKTIERSFRRETDMVARYGGEEFAVLLPGTNSDEARPLVENMLKNINALDIPHSSSEVAKHITISAGVVTHNDEENEKTSSTFIHLADKNLYKAKEGGRNQIIVSA
ncbi:GGDEF domain-containing response regulator [sulfur-oxidizing endosymbiont of Gigantopelta aegis]|uniref:GGDEF domain-containing response regulator n=1 Tax=sulfur-oxidizing endosymbiont of Gigantopelta aegis TaxID=2794934 RepID=UPI0018DCFB71|nr:diguanylate cyclase [sulfur-oxidizing endosymbiont of Gigantopelta aegis]